MMLSAYPGSGPMGTVMRGRNPDSARQDALRQSQDGRIRREEEGVTIEEFDPQRAPTLKEFMRRNGCGA